MRKPKYTLGGIGFSTKDAIKAHVQALFQKYSDHQTLTQDDQQFALDLLKWHPSHIAKIGCGVASVRMKRDSWSRAFVLVRIDGSEENFSYLKCLKNGLMSHPSKAKEAMRRAIAWQVSMFKREAFNGQDTVICGETGKRLRWKDCDVDHYPKPFITIAEEWLAAQELTFDDIALVPSRKDNFPPDIKDPTLRFSWQQWHRYHARYRILDPHENSRLGAHGRYKSALTGD